MSVVTCSLGCEENFVFDTPEEQNFAEKVQQIWWCWEEKLMTTRERIAALKNLEETECLRVTGPKKKEILRASVQFPRRAYQG